MVNFEILDDESITFKIDNKCLSRIIQVKQDKATYFGTRVCSVVFDPRKIKLKSITQTPHGDLQALLTCQAGNVSNLGNSCEYEYELVKIDSFLHLEKP